MQTRRPPFAPSPPSVHVPESPPHPPPVLAPPARAFLAPIADDRIPVGVRLFLVGGGDLEGERLALLERRTAVDADTGNPHDGELHDQFIAGLAARIVTRCLPNGGYFRIRKGGSVKARGFMRIVVEPETDRVLRSHVPVLHFSVVDLSGLQGPGDLVSREDDPGRKYVRADELE